VSDSLQQGFQLGQWRVYPNQGLLEGADGQAHLEPKIMEVLVITFGPADPAQGCKADGPRLDSMRNGG